LDNPNYDFLKSKFRYDKTTYSILQKLGKIKKLKLGDTIVEQGSKSGKVAIVISGLIRAYRTLESGKEITKNIFAPSNFISAFSSLVKDEPSLFCYEALVESIIFEIDFKEFIEVAKTNIKISNLYNRVMEDVITVYELRQLESIALNATERYLKLIERIPNIEKLIPQYQIASYLNVSPVQLSRIRKTLIMD